MKNGKSLEQVFARAQKLGIDPDYLNGLLKVAQFYKSHSVVHKQNGGKWNEACCVRSWQWNCSTIDGKVSCKRCLKAMRSKESGGK